jgi:hypothetical protein
MQPYFFPYAGYFRLLSCVDEFVIYDCVQFRRRGRIHRTQVPGPRGEIEWLTLPLAPSPVETTIVDCEFAAGARAKFDDRLRRFDWIRTARGPGAEPIREFLRSPLENVVDFLEGSIRLVVSLLELPGPPKITRSSSLSIDPEVRGQDRILAIISALDGSHYLNAPGGTALYRDEAFAARNIGLEFLQPYDGPYVHLLYDLMTFEPTRIGASIS